ncbi:hypothetical protein EON63_23275 [archaeon]|nr:MAG: hypothetical protein EON63_23275 [archaeon]
MAADLHTQTMRHTHMPGQQAVFVGLVAADSNYAVLREWMVDSNCEPAVLEAGIEVAGEVAGTAAGTGLVVVWLAAGA